MPLRLSILVSDLCGFTFVGSYCKQLLNMAGNRVTRVEQGHTKIRNLPIAVTPEGFCFFAHKLSQQQFALPCLEIDVVDVENYIETGEMLWM
ncbi:hypothetical protein HHK36_008471 [Tetracentron sinense]|uniref:Uncharacterized protein n=1 Tax=Tetracentron sinense TaxID=13715 RepID=A0A835DND9_TETSI|nr:hypothetical protein HHK36_008471 [Tetracentron sinense]